ncbi:MAG: hypothetical protein H7839_13135 [Magnetococcus sp. YQC-5]
MIVRDVATRMIPRVAIWGGRVDARWSHIQDHDIRQQKAGIVPALGSLLVECHVHQLAGSVTAPPPVPLVVS